MQAADHLMGWELPCVLSPGQDTLPVQHSQEYTTSSQCPTITTSHRDSRDPPKTTGSFLNLRGPTSASRLLHPHFQTALQLQVPPSQAQGQTQAETIILSQPHPHTSSNLNPNFNSNQLQPQPKPDLNSGPTFTLT